MRILAQACVVLAAGFFLAGCGEGSASGSASSTAPSVAATASAPAPGGQNSPATPQTTCPITGGKINKAIFVDYQGKRVYFCCGACPPVFMKDPAKYIKALEDQGVVLEKTPTPARSSAPAEK